MGGRWSSVVSVHLRVFRVKDRSRTNRMKRRGEKERKKEKKERFWLFCDRIFGNKDSTPQTYESSSLHVHQLSSIVVLDPNSCRRRNRKTRVSLSYLFLIIFLLAYTRLFSFTLFLSFFLSSFSTLSLSLSCVRVNKSTLIVSWVTSSSSSGWSVLLATIVRETDWLDQLRR